MRGDTGSEVTAGPGLGSTEASRTQGTTAIEAAGNEGRLELARLSIGIPGSRASTSRASLEAQEGRTSSDANDAEEAALDEAGGLPPVLA